MMSRMAIAAFAVLLSIISVGCHKPAASPAAAAPVPITDYRTCTQGTIEIIISQKTGSPVTLKPAGPNKYTGTRQVPGETQPIPVTVTVEADRIIVESSGGGLKSRDVIDADGKLHSDLR
jgi:hypothetical protein